MGNYYFNITKQERQNILDKHKTVYDGFVTEYGQSINNQPLYIQDFANDKNGITVSNTGVVKNYTNININESNIPIDNIESKPKIRLDYKRMGKEDDTDWVNQLMSSDSELDEGFDDFDIKFDRGDIDFSEKEFPKKNKYPKGLAKVNMDYYDNIDSTLDGFNGDDNFEDFEFYDEVDEEEQEPLKDNIQESLKMFKRFKKYN